MIEELAFHSLLALVPECWDRGVRRCSPWIQELCSGPICGGLLEQRGVKEEN